MAHFGIAIIKKQSSTSSEEDKVFDYLVINDEHSQFKFYEQSSDAFGGTFDFSYLKKLVVDYFDLPTRYEISPNNFENIEFRSIQLFKTEKRDIRATAYEYELSELQIQQINELIKEQRDSNKKLLWLGEKELLSYRNDWKESQKFIFETEAIFQPPNFSNPLRASLKNIVKAKENGKLVIFAGAGVSLDSNVPGWSKLIDELKGDLDETEDNFLKVGQLYFESRGKKEYIEKIKETLKHGETKFNPLHEKIIELEPLHIITTNYDDLFEQVLVDRSLNYSVIKKDIDLPYSKGTSLLIKMHGDFEEKNMVLKQDDYGEKYSSAFPLVEGFIKGIFASKLVVFVGFSLTDPNLTQILKSVRGILKYDNQSPYLFMTRKTNMGKKELNNHKKHKEEIEEEGVKVVEYEDKPFNTYFDQIFDEKDTLRINDLSLIGQKVYKFLRVIEEFDAFSDSLDNLEVENQLINSVLRFKEFGAIPTSVLELIPPFKLKRKSQSEFKTNAVYNDLEPFHLETLNEKLLSFLEGKMVDGKINFYYSKDKNLSLSEQNFHETISLLYLSGVHCILRKNDTSPVHIRLKPVKKIDKCSCSRCLNDSFKFNELIYSLNVLSNKLICKDTKQDLSLTKAYGFFKTGQMIKTFYTLEELRNKSWNNQKYVTYFLATYNLTLLRDFLSYFNDNTLNEYEFDKLREKIEKIDLNQIIIKLPVSPLVRKSLIAIKDNEIFNSTKSTIDSNYISVKEKYLKYKTERYWTSGPNYYYKIEAKFYQLWSFYHKNLIFNDTYTYFIDLANKYLESMILSYCTSKKYEQRLKYFSPFFANTFIFYGRAKELRVLINDCNLEHFQFKDQSKITNEIITSFLSFSKSGFEDGAFFNDIHPNLQYQSAITNSSFFEYQLKTLLRNFLLIFEYIKLSKKQTNDIVDVLINYLQAIPIFQAHKSLDFFSSFISKSILSINDSNLQKTLNYILSDNIWSDDLIKPICSAIINVKKKEDFLGKDYYRKLIRRCDERRKWSVKLENMIPLYPLCIPEQKEQFLKELKPILEKNHIIKRTYHWGIWTPEDNNELYMTFVSDLVRDSKGFANYEIDGDGFPIGIKNFTVWNNLQFMVSIIYKYNFFNQDYVNEIYDSIESDLFKWILKPNTFDYKKFKKEWLLVFNSQDVMKKIKEVKPLTEAVKLQLEEEYDASIAKIYLQKLS